MGDIVNVELSIFSGNPDPVLSIDQDAETNLVQLLTTAIGQQLTSFVEPPGLGYRGFVISNASGQAGLPPVCNVYAKTISVPTETGETQDWSDTGGAEQFLIDQARALGFGDILDQAGAPGTANA
jgi:hypothetical protein